MNALQLAAHAANTPGMGDLSPNLIGIINRGFDFGETFLNAKYSKDAARFTGGNAFQLQQPAGGGTAAADYAAMLAAQRNSELASASVNAEGIKFGNTRISWPTIAIVGLGFFLVQSPGFTKRR